MKINLIEFKLTVCYNLKFYHSAVLNSDNGIKI